MASSVASTDGPRSSGSHTPVAARPDGPLLPSVVIAEGESPTNGALAAPMAATAALAAESVITLAPRGADVGCGPLSASRRAPTSRGREDTNRAPEGPAEGCPGVAGPASDRDIRRSLRLCIPCLVARARPGGPGSGWIRCCRHGDLLRQQRDVGSRACHRDSARNARAARAEGQHPSPLHRPTRLRRPSHRRAPPQAQARPVSALLPPPRRPRLHRRPRARSRRHPPPRGLSRQLPRVRLRAPRQERILRRRLTLAISCAVTPSDANSPSSFRPRVPRRSRPFRRPGLRPCTGRRRRDEGRTSAVHGGGRVLRQARIRERAHVAFLQAYALRKHPAVLINLAQSSLRAGHTLEADHYFQQYLRESTGLTTMQRSEAESGLTEARAKLGRLQVSAPTGVDVSVDGTSAGAAPLSDSIDVEPGAHTVKASGDTRSVTVAGGQVTEVRFGAPAPVAPVAPRRPRSRRRCPPPEPAPAPPPAAEKRRPSRTRVPVCSSPCPRVDGTRTWVGVVVSAAGFATAIVFGVFKGGAQNNYNSLVTEIKGTATMDGIMNTKGLCVNPSRCSSPTCRARRSVATVAASTRTRTVADVGVRRYGSPSAPAY